MTTLTEITAALDEELGCARFPEAHLNGLQFEGVQDVVHAALAVDSALATVEAAVEAGAQLLFVHHGIFWGSAVPVCGAVRRLYKTILEHNLSLYAAHLPLDAHPVLGNNACLSRELGLSDFRFVPASFNPQMSIGCVAGNKAGLTLKDLANRCRALGSAKYEPLTLAFGPAVPERVYVVSGAAADELTSAARLGFDTLITGEPRHFAYHYCRENGLNAIFAGHYASETLGVQAVGRFLSERFQLQCTFVDQPTGI